MRKISVLQAAAPFTAIDAAQLEQRLHDLSQPVTAVSVALCVASVSDSAEERAHVLEAAQRECDRIIVQIRRMREVLQSAEEMPPPLRERCGAVHCISAGQSAQEDLP